MFFYVSPDVQLYSRDDYPITNHAFANIDKCFCFQLNIEKSTSLDILKGSLEKIGNVIKESENHEYFHDFPRYTDQLAQALLLDKKNGVILGGKCLLFISEKPMYFKNLSEEDNIYACIKNSFYNIPVDEFKKTLEDKYAPKESRYKDALYYNTIALGNIHRLEQLISGENQQDTNLEDTKHCEEQRAEIEAAFSSCRGSGQIYGFFDEDIFPDEINKYLRIHNGKYIKLLDKVIVNLKEFNLDIQNNNLIFYTRNKDGKQTALSTTLSGKHLSYLIFDYADSIPYSFFQKYAIYKIPQNSYEIDAIIDTKGFFRNESQWSLFNSTIRSDHLNKVPKKEGLEPYRYSYMNITLSMEDEYTIHEPIKAGMISYTDLDDENKLKLKHTFICPDMYKKIMEIRTYFSKNWEKYEPEKQKEIKQSLEQAVKNLESDKIVNHPYLLNFKGTVVVEGIYDCLDPSYRSYISQQREPNYIKNFIIKYPVQLLYSPLIDKTLKLNDSLMNFEDTEKYHFLEISPVTQSILWKYHIIINKDEISHPNWLFYFNLDKMIDRVINDKISNFSTSLHGANENLYEFFLRDINYSDAFNVLKKRYAENEMFKNFIIDIFKEFTDPNKYAEHSESLRKSGENRIPDSLKDQDTYTAMDYTLKEIEDKMLEHLKRKNRAICQRLSNPEGLDKQIEKYEKSLQPFKAFCSSVLSVPTYANMISPSSYFWPCIKKEHNLFSLTESFSVLLKNILIHFNHYRSKLGEILQKSIESNHADKIRLQDQAVKCKNLYNALYELYESVKKGEEDVLSMDPCVLFNSQKDLLYKEWPNQGHKAVSLFIKKLKTCYFENLLEEVSKLEEDQYYEGFYSNLKSKVFNPISELYSSFKQEERIIHLFEILYIADLVYKGLHVMMPAINQLKYDRRVNGVKFQESDHLLTNLEILIQYQNQ